MAQLKFIDKKLPEVEELLVNIKCMIITTTEIETEMFREKFRPININEGVIRLFHGSHTFYIGKFGSYLVAHVQCNVMGGISPGASMSTASAGISLFKPNAVIMAGIAFGVDPKKQKIGNVIVSEAIIPYNIARISRDDIQFRNNIPLSGLILINRFKNGCADWNFPIRRNRAKVFFGKVLSGEHLIDNQEYRDTLIQRFAGVIGGEMEGAGLFAAAHEHKVEWIIVKGICDFADGNKGKNKAANQRIAAKSAVSLCEHVLSIDSIFNDLQIPAFVTKRERCQIFNDNWNIHAYKHFEILNPILCYYLAEGIIHLKVSIKNIVNNIGTCYVVVKFARSNSTENLILNTDTDFGNDALEKFKIFDIYPGEFKTIETTIESPAFTLNSEMEFKVEVWSPARHYHIFSTDDRIALFDRSLWQKVMLN